MNKEEIREKFRIEATIRDQFNKLEHFDAKKAEPFVGPGSQHEFDIFEIDKVYRGNKYEPLD